MTRKLPADIPSPEKRGGHRPDVRDIDQRTDDYAMLTNEELANTVDRLKMTYGEHDASYLILRLVAARLRGEKPLNLTRQ